MIQLPKADLTDAAFLDQQQAAYKINRANRWNHSTGKKDWSTRMHDANAQDMQKIASGMDKVSSFLDSTATMIEKFGGDSSALHIVSGATTVVKEFVKYEHRLANDMIFGNSTQRLAAGKDFAIDAAVTLATAGIGMVAKPLLNVAASSLAKARMFSKVGVIGGENVAKTIRFTEIASKISKTEARALLRQEKLTITDAQAKAILKQLKSGRMDTINIKHMNDETVHLSIERAGHTSGYQRMSFKINKNGNNIRIVQTAFDDNGNIVHQLPGTSKNNLYDVKL